MLEIQYYSIVYFITLTCLQLVILIPFFSQSSAYVYTNRTNNILSSLILVFIVLYFGFRDPYGSWQYLGDTHRYTELFNYFKDGGNLLDKRDIGFYYFMKICSSLLPVNIFYLLCAYLYVVLPYFCYRYWFNDGALVALLLTISSLSFFGFGINGIRNGLATSIFLYAMIDFKYPIMRYILLAIAAAFHNSLLLPILGLAMTKYEIAPIQLMKVWLASLGFVLVVGSDLVEYLNNLLNFFNLETERSSIYFSNYIDENFFEFRFRWDFVIYSLVPIVFGYRYVYILGYIDRRYLKLLNLYTIINTIWLFCIYLPYTNRIAYLSWFVAPMVVIYPLLVNRSNSGNNARLAIIVVFNLLTTLILQFK